MTEALPESLSDRIKSYLDSISDHSIQVPQRRIDFADQADFQEKFIYVVKRSLARYLSINLPTKISSNKGLNHLFKEVILDTNGPLVLRMYKSGNYEEGNLVSHQLFLTLRKDSELVSAFGLVVGEQEFELVHREVRPPYRGQGLASIAFQAIEAFVADYSNQDQCKKPIIHCTTAQLNVVNWLLKNDFKPIAAEDHKSETHDLQEVIESLETGDRSYTISPEGDLYVFPATFKGPHTLPDGKVDFKNAARVNFVKELDSAVQATAVTIQNLVKVKLPS